MKQLGQLLLIHFREFFREPAVLFWALFFPAALALVLGLAFRSPSDTTVQIGLIIKSDEARGEQVKHQIEKDDRFRVQIYTEAMAEHALKSGKIHLVVVVRPSDLLFRYDPASDAAVKEASMLKAALLHDLLYGQDGPSAGSFIKDEKLDIPGTRYIDYFIPGLLAFDVMNACLWGIGWSLISMRMKKLLRRMAATPMNHNLFFLSFGLARIVLVAVETIFLMVVAYLFFDLKPVGSLLDLALLFLAGTFCFSGLAVLLASKTANTQVGNGLINAALLPMMLLSGIFFSYHGFPDFLQPVIQWLPLTIFADAVRSVYLEGQSILALWPSLIILTTAGLLMFLLGRRLFRWD